MFVLASDRAPGRAALALLALAAALGAPAGGCSSKRPPSLLLHVGGVSAGGTDRCAAQQVINGDTLTQGLGVPPKALRVTLRSRDAAGKTVDFCDSIVLGTTAPVLLAPKGGKLIDLFVEAYGNSQPGDPMSAGGVRLLATGSLLGIDPDAQTETLTRLYPTEVFRCAGGHFALPRAFHTATVLPDGRVLFVGGLIARTIDPMTCTPPSLATAVDATATGDAEIYDPLDQSLTKVSEDQVPAARAFHSAQLVPGATACPAGQVAILLVGGLAPFAEGCPIVAVSTGAQGGRLVPFAPGPTPYPAYLHTVPAASEYLCLNLAAKSATRVQVSDPSAAVFQGADEIPGVRAIAAGGLTYDNTMLNTAVPSNTIASIDLSAGSSAGTTTLGPTPVARSGATATLLDGTSALVWGGGGSSDPVGDLITALDGAPSVAALSATTTAITQFHTATLLDGSASPSVLVTGGFEVTSGGVNLQPPDATGAVRVVTVTGGSATPQPVLFAAGFDNHACDNVTNGARYRPAGWERATKLPNGGVLITGGTPATAASGSRCADCPSDPSLLCAISQATLYDSGVGTIRRTKEPMQVARFGHTSTMLPDGTVLIAGGIGSETDTGVTSAVFLRDLEVYNPRLPLAPIDKTGLNLDDPIVGDLGNLRRTPGAQVRPCDTL